MGEILPQPSADDGGLQPQASSFERISQQVNTVEVQITYAFDSPDLKSVDFQDADHTQL